jgi:hypothetical protein
MLNKAEGQGFLWHLRMESGSKAWKSTEKKKIAIFGPVLKAVQS